MSLTQAIKNESIEELVAAVEKAVEIYPAECPEEPTVCTAYGMVKLSTLDAESRLEVAAQYVDMLKVKLSAMPEGPTRKIDLAMLIAQDATLRNIGKEISGEGLL